MKKKRNIFLEMKKNWAAYLLLAPFMILFFVFTIMPVFVTLGISFTTYNILESPVFVGLDNYKRLFLNDDIFAIAIKNTLIFALFTGPLGYVLSFLASWAINETSKRLRGLLTFVFYIPSISGTIYTIWTIIFSGDMYGYANSFLMRMGFIVEPIQWFTTEQYILPLIIVMTAAVLQITAMFSNATVAQNLAGFPSTNYAGHLVMTHLMDYSTFRVERGYASAIAVLLFLIMIILNQIILRVMRKVDV